MNARIAPLLLFCACQDPARAPGQDGTPPDEDRFADAGAVVLRSPAEGAAVESPFALRYTAGEQVSQVRVAVDGVWATRREDAAGSLLVEAEPGRRRVELVGYDRQGQELSRDEVDLRVLAPDAEGWVSFFTPTPDATSAAPVALVLQASDNTVAVEVFADGRSLGEFPVDQVVWSDLGGASGAVTLRAEALDEGGSSLGDDEVEVEVLHAEDPGVSAFNGLILDLIETYPTDGTYSYYWPSSGSWSGSTRDIWYQDTRVADDGGYSACYCSGITWELYLRAWADWDRAQGGEADDLNGLDASALLTLRRDWYVREVDGPGPNLALENGGLGTTVASVDDWRPGDLVQFWRSSGSGHTVVFMGWSTDDSGERDGFEYVSCQGASDGFGLNTERFGTHEGAILPLKMYAGRAFMPEGWE